MRINKQIQQGWHEDNLTQLGQKDKIRRRIIESWSGNINTNQWSIDLMDNRENGWNILFDLVNNESNLPKSEH